MYDYPERGVALKVIEGNMLTLRPALTITKCECDLIVTTLEIAFKRNKL